MLLSSRTRLLKLWILSLLFVPTSGFTVPYDFSFTEEEIKVRNSTSLPAPTSCSPVYVGSFLRHGTRNPSYTDIKEAQQLMDRIAGQIKAPELNHLNNWVFRYTNDQAFQMNDVGYREMAGLGRRWAERVTELLEDASEAEVQFIVGETKRSKESAELFRQGMSEVLGDRFDDLELVVNTTLTQLFDECERYDAEVAHHNPIAYREYDKFLEGPEMAAVGRALSQRLQLAVTDLTPVEVVTIFHNSKTDVSLTGSSPWSKLCSDPFQVEVLNYAKDLLSYYDRWYGCPFIVEASCVTLEKFIHQMELVVSAREQGESSHPKATFMNGFSRSLLPLMSLLGLYQTNTPYTAENFAEQSDRTFRINRIDPMGAGLMFLLYECEPGAHGELNPHGVDWPPELDRFMIQLFFKEMSIKIPGSCGYDLCPYKLFRKQFADKIDKCNWEKSCAVTSQKVMTSKATKNPLAEVTSQSIVSSGSETKSRDDAMDSSSRNDVKFSDVTSRRNLKRTHQTSSTAEFLISYLQHFLLDWKKDKD